MHFVTFTFSVDIFLPFNGWFPFGVISRYSEGHWNNNGGKETEREKESEREQEHCGLVSGSRGTRSPAYVPPHSVVGCAFSAHKWCVFMDACRPPSSLLTTASSSDVEAHGNRISAELSLKELLSPVSVHQATPFLRFATDSLTSDLVLLRSFHSHRLVACSCLSLPPTLSYTHTHTHTELDLLV